MCVHVHSGNSMETMCANTSMEGLADYWHKGRRALITQIKTLQRCLFHNEFAT